MESLWVWLAFNAFVVVLLTLDLGVLHRKDREIGVREALGLSLLYVLLAGTFATGIFLYHPRGEAAGLEFVTGYLIEKSLSLDNIFVFVLIFTHFQVPAAYQHRVLFWGILGALAMRAAMILAGVQLIHWFEPVVLLFGAFLILTGIKMLWAINQEPDLENNRVIRFARRHLRVTDDYHGHDFFARRDGVLWVTPLFLVLVLVEASDAVFAVDSIPAILAISTDPFIVYTSNVFAILGLRALYFALANVVHRFHYLKVGLSLVLVTIGAKMILNGVNTLFLDGAWGDKVVPTEWALVLTAVLIGGSILVSLARPAPEAKPQGWVPGTTTRQGKPHAEPRPAGD
ncbi:MAG TPA: TerC family protein [Azospirillaceae bacterium]|nr:TerC family protein [Azospirillaceae bacterium]